MNRFNSIILELHYLPCIQYFTKLLHYPSVILEQKEHYQKGSYRNRTLIATANGILRLSIPLKKGKNEQQPIRSVEIAYDENWQAQHWQAIRSAYGNAPFFEFYADELKAFYEKQLTNHLFDFNLMLLNFLLEKIQMNPNIDLSVDYKRLYPASVQDFRNSITPRKKDQKEDLLFHPMKYPQVFQEKHGFLPNLSILDALFCLGPGALILLEQSINKNN